MLSILNNSKSGMIAFQEKVDIISNNVANMSTAGYKRLDSSFSDLMYSTLNRTGTPNSGTSSVVGSGVKHSNIYRDKTQGALLQTDIKTDLAIDGPGYFRVTLPNGDFAYTRSGDFKLDEFGKLIDKSGNVLEITYLEDIETESLNMTSDNISIDKYGLITIIDGNGASQTIGKINLYDVSGENSFISVGDNLFSPSDNNVVVYQTNSDIHQGFLENSNVDIGKEFSELIINQRAYQLSSKGIQAADEMWSLINQIR